MKLILFLLIATGAAFAQGTGNVTMALFPGVPTGSCTARQLALNQSNGALYICQTGAWQIISGGGGGWNPPSNTPGDTIFGNNTVSTGTASFFTPGGDVSFSAGNFSVNALHFGPNVLTLTNTGIASGNYLQISGSTIIGATGTGGGGGLTGCTTPTSGNLVCDNSIQGGTGTVGMLTLPYAGALPTPPSGAQAAIAADSTGHLFSSTGNNAAFVAIGGGGAGAPATGLQFGSTSNVFALSTTAPTNGQCLTINGSTIEGGACGAAAGPATALQFNGTTLPLGTPAPTAGQYLAYNGTAIVGITPPSGSVVLLAGGQSYTLPAVAPTANWCVGVMAVSGSGQQLIAGASLLNNQSGAIMQLPLWQMIHVCEAPVH